MGRAADKRYSLGPTMFPPWLSLRCLTAFLLSGVAALAMTLSVVCAIALVARLPPTDVINFEPILREISTPVLIGVFFGGCGFAFLCHFTVRKVLRLESIRELFPPAVWRGPKW